MNSVYRALRSINLSPDLFFLIKDLKYLVLHRSNQIIVKDRKTEIHPIAGTFKRNGDDEKMRF
jgi:anthranilate synthase component 1